MAEKQAIHAFVSEEVHAAWHEMCEEEGISLSGFIEVLGSDLARHPAGPERHPRWDEIVRATRKIDAVRRRRKGGGRRTT